MSKPKFGPTSARQSGKTADMKARLATDKGFGQQLAKTIESIETDRLRGRLGSSQATTEFYYLPDGVDLEKPITGEALGVLVAVRMRMQGYKFEFDPEVIKETLAKGTARMQRLTGN